MSYILEALKKAQAERQLGSAPTIHAMPIQPLPTGPASASRTPIIAGAAVLVVAAAIAAALWWKPRAPAVSVAAAPPVAVQPAVVAPVPAPVVQVAPPAPAVQLPAPAPAPVAVAKVVPPEAPPPAAKPKPNPQPAARLASAAPAPVPAAPPAPAEAPEEHYPLLRELPEAVQREVPRVAIGGYIYSKNPSDRLLLVDKVLRREGEDVGAGLILEKLQSKAAVMNYRGTRYRIPY